jgi:peptidoglycan hydrolase CwlO-like protein
MADLTALQKKFEKTLKSLESKNTDLEDVFKTISSQEAETPGSHQDRLQKSNKPNHLGK